MRTQEEIEAAREASRANTGITSGGKVTAPAGPARKAGAGTGSAPRTDNG